MVTAIQRRQPDKPVRSAEAVAALRAASVREEDPLIRNPDYLAHIFVRGRYRLILSLLLALPSPLRRLLIERIKPGGYCFFIARTRFFDEHLQAALARGVTQVVILGAGYDSRAIRFADCLKQSEVFEVDLPSTQATKRERMREAGIVAPANLHFISHNFQDRDLLEALKAAGLVPERPTFFIWEGVTYYLMESAVRDIFESIIGRCAHGSSVAFDYSLRSFVDGDDGTYGSQAMHRWLARNNEPFRFGLNAGQLGPYLRPFGLQVTEDIGPDDVRSRYLTDSRQCLVGEPLGHLRMAHAVLDDGALLTI